ACSPYLCNGQTPACTQMNCFGDDFCAAGFFCDSTGHCAAQKTGGAACGGGACLKSGCRECGAIASFAGGCANGFCCDRACAGGCERCDATPGTCTPVAKMSSSCGDYWCDGTHGACPT